jgi:hypothetical protein
VFEDVGEGLLNDSVDHKPKGLGDHRLLPSHLEFNFHPGLVHATVTLAYSPTAIYVEILDEGYGAAVQGDGRGHGLQGIL